MGKCINCLAFFRQRFVRYVFHELRVPFNLVNMALELPLEEKGQKLSASGDDTLQMSIQVYILYDCMKCFCYPNFIFIYLTCISSLSSVVYRDEDNYGRYIRLLCQD
jgi:hypothetical protein